MNSAASPVSRELTPDDIEKRVRIVREIMAWGKANGYPDIRWTAADEAWGDSLRREYDSMKAVKDGGGNVWVATGIQFFDLVGECLDKVRARHGVDGVGRARLVGDGLLGPQGCACCILGGQSEGFILCVDVERLRPAEDGGERLVGSAHDVDVGLLRLEGDAGGLGVEAHHP